MQQAESKNLRGLNGNGNGNGNGNSAGGNNGNGNSPDRVTVIVQLTKDKTKGPASRCNDRANANGGSVLSVYNRVFQGCAIEVNPNQVEKMKQDVEFEVVEMDQVVHASESYDGEYCIRITCQKCQRRYCQAVNRGTIAPLVNLIIVQNVLTSKSVLNVKRIGVLTVSPN